MTDRYDMNGSSLAIRRVASDMEAQLFVDELNDIPSILNDISDTLDFINERENYFQHQLNYMKEEMEAIDELLYSDNSSGSVSSSHGGKLRKK